MRKGFYMIGALRTNHIIYPCGICRKVSEFALHLRKTDPNVNLVTVDCRGFYGYRYEGEPNEIPNAAEILSYPKVLRVFISTNVGLSTQDILDTYTKCWPSELFFGRAKVCLPWIHTRYVPGRE